MAYDDHYESRHRVISCELRLLASDSTGEGGDTHQQHVVDSDWSRSVLEEDFQLPYVELSPGLHERFVSEDSGKDLDSGSRLVILRFKDTSLCRESLVYSTAIRCDRGKNSKEVKYDNEDAVGDSTITRDCVFLNRSTLRSYDVTEHLIGLDWNTISIEVEVMGYIAGFDLTHVIITLGHEEAQESKERKEENHPDSRSCFRERQLVVSQGRLARNQDNSVRWMIKSASPFMFGRITGETSMTYSRSEPFRETRKRDQHEDTSNYQIKHTTPSRRFLCDLNVLRRPVSPLYIKSKNQESRYDVDVMSGVFLTSYSSQLMDLEPGDLVQLEQEESLTTNAANDDEMENSKFKLLCSVPVHIWSCSKIERILSKNNKGLIRLHASPWFWHSLGISRISRTRLRIKKMQTDKPLSYSYAEECHFSHIHGEFDTSVQARLEDYFKTSRLLREGTIFGVISDDLRCLNYFKVVLIQNANQDTSVSLSALSSFYYVNRYRTRVLLKGHQEERLPRYFRTFLLPDLETFSTWSFLGPITNETTIQKVSIMDDISLGEKLNFLYEFFDELFASPVNDLWYGIQCSKRNRPWRLLNDISEQCGVVLHVISPHELMDETQVKILEHFQKILDTVADRSYLFMVLYYVDNVLQLSESLAEDFVRAIDEMLQKPALKPRKRLICLMSEDIKKLPNAIRSRFHSEIIIGPPSKEARLNYLKLMINSKRHPLDISIVASRTSGYLKQDLEELVIAMEDQAFEEWNGKVSPDYRPFLTLDQHHFEFVLASKQRIYSGLSDTIIHIPRVSWDDIGGLVSIKRDILDMIELPLRHSELFIPGLKRRSGILFYGPPGTGKTLLAKAIATECHLNFISVKGPELLSMYVGESERHIRDLFVLAREAKPCILFFDEIDALAPRRGRSGDSGGVSDRLVSQLLTELDTINGSNDIFLIGATNRPELIDPALLRPGRFDKLVYLGVPEDHESQLNILKALTRQLRLASDCDLRNIVEKCPFTLSGADFYALTMDAMMSAIRRKLIQLQRQTELSFTSQLLEDWIEGMTEDSLRVELGEIDFEQALRCFSPSISQAELKRCQFLKLSFQS